MLTELSDRQLWYDGESTYKSEQLASVLGAGVKVRWVDVITPEIERYNRIANSNSEIAIKNECGPLSRDWNIPGEFSNLNVVEYIISKHNELVANFPEAELSEREERLAAELVKFNQFGLFDVLRVMAYIVFKLEQKQIVYGVGRGSSVSSYLLFVLGVHDVDSFKYELDMDDFLHE